MREDRYMGVDSKRELTRSNFYVKDHLFQSWNAKSYTSVSYSSFYDFLKNVLRDGIQKIYVHGSTLVIVRGNFYVNSKVVIYSLALNYLNQYQTNRRTDEEAGLNQLRKWLS